MSAALREAIAAALAAARREGCDQWVAWSTRDHPQRDPLAALSPAAEDAFFYAVPEAGLALAARGAEATVECAGPSRFTAADAALRDAALRVWTATEGDPAGDGGPLWVGGFAFGDEAGEGAWSGFPAARWWLPRELWLRRGGESRRIRVRRVASGDDPQRIADALRAEDVPRSAASERARGDERTSLAPSCPAATHAARVARALAAIARGELEKVVLARALDVERAAPFDPLVLLGALRSLYPESASYGIARGGSWLVGASPERLLRRAGRSVEAMALAGSAPRGRTPEEDARRRQSLVESKKEQSEHAIAVRGLREALAADGAALSIPEAPDVLALAGVQHLRTPIHALLPPDGPGLLALAGRVHPSAAVAGAPRAPALAWLAEHEALERGWYAGLVGWTTREGDGELSAALRCALLRGGRARLFAGGGIVAGSEPRAEVAETRLKWNALLPALLEL